MNKKTFLGFIALLLACGLVIACGIGSQVGGKWFKNKDITSWFNNWGISKPADNPDNDYSGLVVSMDTKNEVMTLSVDDSDEIADTVMITATLNDLTAKDRNIIFSLDWKDSCALSISDYVVMTIQGNTATVNCLQAFSCRMLLTASVENTDVSATCELNYLKPLNNPTDICFVNKGTSLSSPSNTLQVDYDSDINNCVSSSGINGPNVLGAGTVSGEIKINSIKLILNYLSSDGTERSISSTSAFDNLRKGFTYDPTLSGGVSVKEYVEIKDFSKSDNGLKELFNLNLWDFFNFSSWDKVTRRDFVERQCAGALLESCGNSNTRQIKALINYSYVYGDKSWTYEQELTVSVDFENLTTETTGVNLDISEYTFCD